MDYVINVQACYVHWGIGSIGGSSLLMGIFSIFWPRKSMQLYIWMMAKFNWRVSPIDDQRELSSTRRFGVYLTLLACLTLFLLFYFIKRF